MGLYKTDVTPEIFGQLHKLLKQEGNPFELTQHVKGMAERINFVDILPRDYRYDGNYMNIALELKEQIENSTAEERDFLAVDRSMLDLLCDHLDIFPRTKPNDDLIAEVIKEVRFILGVAATLAAQVETGAAAENVSGIQMICNRLLEKLKPK